MVLYSHSYFLGGFGPETFLSWSRGHLILGTVGVQGFFVLSGSLIATSWIRRASLGRFLWCRLLRLAPALWICLLFTAVAIGPLIYFTTAGAHSHYLLLKPSPVGYVANNLLRPRAQVSIGGLPTDVPMPGDLNGSLWTLFYEGACYLMIAALGVAGLLGRARIWGAVLLISFVALNSMWAIDSSSNWLPILTGRLFDTPGKMLTVFFLMGAFWALFPQGMIIWTHKFWPGLLACAILVASWHWGADRWLAPWVMPPALFWLAAKLPFTGLESRLGDYSYGIYIYGYPVEQVLAHFGIQALGHPAFLISGAILAGILGAVSWHLVEKPALGLKEISLRAA
jgi:peptidoglycan/LPS O-acetylase OafA/YrhL